MNHTTPDLADRVAAALGRAADQIEQRGLCKQALYRDGQVCTLGAIAISAGLNAWDWQYVGGWADGDGKRGEKARLALQAAMRLAQHLGYRIKSPLPSRQVDNLSATVGFGWNDRQSSETVIATLRQAAEKARSA